MNKHIFSVSLTTVLICGAVLRTEAQDIRLSYGVGIADGGEKTDGVTFRVELHREGHEPVVLSEEKWAQNAWHDTEVDLTPYAEQKVRLRFVTEPGETTTDDWACWGTPAIWQGEKMLADLTATRLWQTGVIAPQEGTPVPMATDETGATFLSGERSCGGVRRRAFFAHPPWKGELSGGATFADFLVTVGEASTPSPVRPPLPVSGADSSPFPLGLAPCFRVATPLSADGSLADWPERVLSAPLVLRERKQLSVERVSHKPGWKAGWTGPRDLSATIYLAWDDANLYIAEIRRDDRLMTMDTMSNGFTASDALRICVARDDAAETTVIATVPLGERDLPMARRITVTDAGKTVDSDTDIRVAPALYGNGWIQEIAIPFDSIGGTPRKGETMRFQLILTDSDTPMEQHYEMRWNPKQDRHGPRAAEGYGTVTFCENSFAWLRPTRTAFATGERPLLSCGLFPPGSPAAEMHAVLVDAHGRETPFCDATIASGSSPVQCAALVRPEASTVRYELACDGATVSGTCTLEVVADPADETATPLRQPSAPTLRPSQAGDMTTAVQTNEDGSTVFTCTDERGSLSYAVRPALGFDIEIALDGEPFYRSNPATTGPRLDDDPTTGAPASERAHILAVRTTEDHLTYQCHVQPGTVISYDFSLAGRTLVVDLASSDGTVTGVEGPLHGLEAEAIFVPYLHPVLGVYRHRRRFVSSYADWTVTGSSRLGRLGSTVYTPDTEGSRNPLRERLYLTVSPRFTEALANLPNPPSPYIDMLAGKVVMDCWGWGNTFSDTTRYLETLKGYGVDELAIIYHVWQNHGYDNGLPEHLPANEARGGDLQMRMLGTTAKRLGYLFSLHENYIDYYPNFPEYTDEAVALDSRGGKIAAWYMPSTGIQSYRLKPSWIERYVADQSPQIHRRYRTTAAYLDVHSVGLPFQLDFDAEAPGASSLRYTFERICELFESMRRIHGGPLFGEGNFHAVWAGRIDGCEAQIGGRGGEINPVLPDYDLLKVHPLAVNHGMGYYTRWQREKRGTLDQEDMTKYRAQELAYGHAGFFNTGAMANLSQVLQEYYLVQPLQARYAPSAIRTIRYLFDPEPDGGGRWVTSEVACLTDAPRKVHTAYENGLNLWINDGRDAWVIQGRALPPYGFVAQGTDISAYTARLNNGWIGDFVETPNRIFLNPRTYEALYVDTSDTVGIAPLAPTLTSDGDRRFQIAYRWSVESVPERDYVIFVHFTDESGRILWQDDHRAATPVAQWPLGETFVDGPHAVDIPAAIGPGRYQVRVGMYLPKIGRLTLSGKADPSRSYRVGWLEVPKPDSRESISLIPETTRDGAEQPGANPPEAQLDFGIATTDITVRIDRETDGLVVMPIPHGKEGTVVLHMDRILPGRAMTAPQATALASDRTPIGDAPLIQTGATLTLQTTVPEAWFYRVSLR